MRNVELLIPASSLEVLKTAVKYGADAVYIGGEVFGLRAKAKNFSLEEMREGVKFAHEHNVKVYVTANILAHNADLEPVRAYFEDLKTVNMDALIIADPAIFTIAKEMLPDTEIHISTQANNTNYGTYNFWYNLGAKRVVTARELSMKEIKEIREHIPDDMEIETFVHGAMCISYSGRCLLSSYMTGRDSNRGACAQSCRWKYYLVEEKRPNEYFPIEEDQHGTYIMNSKDLCMIEHIPELMQAGAQSLKIEGRNKSEYYLALVVKAYRQAIDLYCEDPENYKLPKALLDEMYKVSHREYHTGFFFNEPKHEGIIYKTNNHVREYDVVAIVHEYDEETQIATCKQRNKFSMGEKVEILSSNSDGGEFVVEELYDLEGNKLESCPHPGMMCKVKVPYKVEKNSFIRKELI